MRRLVDACDGVGLYRGLGASEITVLESDSQASQI